VPEGGGHQAVARDRVHAGGPAPRHRGFAFHVAEGVDHGAVVRLTEYRA
jgi:hypothetical protein